jgi:long-chain acyl-CoA synthetase
MIIQKLLQFALEVPDKQAIVYEGRVFSYANLWAELQWRAEVLGKIEANNILLHHPDELENLLNFLAIMAINKAGIFTGKNLNDSQITAVAEKNKAFILDKSLVPGSKHPNNLDFTPKPSTLFLGVLTSGSTATPNLIWKDYQAWFSAFPHQSEVFGIDKNDRLFVLNALAYSANLNSVLHMLWLGGSVVLTSLKTANSWHKQIENEAITSIFMVPSHYKLLVKNQKISPKIKSLVSAGEKLDAQLAQTLCQMAPQAILTEYYGSAELGHITYHQNQEIIDNPLSVGKPFPGVEIRIEKEQIFVESNYISPEYRKLKTNFDLGYFVDNQLILMGRVGRMFNRRGLNVFAEEIENTVKVLTFVSEAAVIGILQPDHSHELSLAYSCTTGYQNNGNNQLILNHLASQLQATKVPSRLQEFENLPRTESGKIDFKALARTFEEEILV